MKEYRNKDSSKHSSKQRLIPINCQHCINKLEIFAVYVMQSVQIPLIPMIFLRTDSLKNVL